MTSIKKIFSDMLRNPMLQTKEIQDFIWVVGEILQAEGAGIEIIEGYYTPEIIKLKDMYTDIATRYDSENFVNILRDYGVLPRTVNKLIPIHRRRASNNILKLISREYFSGYNIDMKMDYDREELAIEIYATSETEIDKETVFAIFEKIKDRLLIAGVKKLLRLVLKMFEAIDPPYESWTFQTEWGIKWNSLVEDYSNKSYLELIQFNGNFDYFMLRRDKIASKNRLFITNKEKVLQDDFISLDNAYFDEIFILKTPYVTENIRKPLEDNTFTIKNETKEEIKSPTMTKVYNRTEYVEQSKPPEIKTMEHTEKPDEQVSIPNEIFGVWYPGTRRIGVGKQRFIIGKTKLSLEYTYETL